MEHRTCIINIIRIGRVPSEFPVIDIAWTFCFLQAFRLIYGPTEDGFVGQV